MKTLLQIALGLFFGALILAVGSLLGSGDRSLGVDFDWLPRALGFLASGEFWRVVVELTKALAWPIAIIIGVCLFKSDIRSLVPRVRKVGPGGVEIDPADQQRNVPSAPQPNSPTPGSQSLTPPSPAVARVESEIQNELSRLPEDQQRAALVRQLSVTRLAAFFENTYAYIFGSQIHGLRLLNGASPVSLEEAKNFYEREAKGKHAEAYETYTFEQWLQYMINRLLVEKGSDGVKITDIGREFLHFLHVMKYPESKPL